MGKEGKRGMAEELNEGWNKILRVGFLACKDTCARNSLLFLLQRKTTTLPIFPIIFKSLYAHTIYFVQHLGLICICGDVYEICVKTFLEGTFLCASSFCVCAIVSRFVSARTRAHLRGNIGPFICCVLTRDYVLR